MLGPQVSTRRSFPRKRKRSALVLAIVLFSIGCWLTFRAISASMALLSEVTVWIMTPGEANTPRSFPMSGIRLSVPFYVYKDLAWETATFGPYNVSDLARTPTIFQKHSDDYWLMKASLRHPMRTLDPSKAKLFFIPTLFNMLAYRSNPHFLFPTAGKSNDLCWNGMCNGKLIQYTHCVLLGRNATICKLAAISNSSNASSLYKISHDRDKSSLSWIESRPQHHLIVNSHFFARPQYPFWNKTFSAETGVRDLLYQVNMIRFEDATTFNHPDRLRLSKLYVGHACPPLSSVEKQQDVAMIATIPELGERQGFRDRRIICESIRWYNAQKQAPDTPLNISSSKSRNAQTTIRMTHCGGRQSPRDTNDPQTLEQCPALSLAKFGFHVRGDTWGSNRLYDTILSGAVPIFTRRQQYPPTIPDWVDWNQLAYFLDMTNVTTRSQFIEKFLPILSDRQGYFQRYEAVLKFRHLFDHTTLFPFDRYMYQLQEYYYPETIDPSDS